MHRLYIAPLAPVALPARNDQLDRHQVSDLHAVVGRPRSGPISATLAKNSCPGMIGKRVCQASSQKWCASEPQMPHASIWTIMPRGPVSGQSNSCDFKASSRPARPQPLLCDCSSREPLPLLSDGPRLLAARFASDKAGSVPRASGIISLLRPKTRTYFIQGSMAALKIVFAFSR